MKLLAAAISKGKEVRLAVAKQGYGLNRLSKDIEWSVREEAKKQLAERESAPVSRGQNDIER